MSRERLSLRVPLSTQEGVALTLTPLIAKLSESRRSGWPGGKRALKRPFESGARATLPDALHREGWPTGLSRLASRRAVTRHDVLQTTPVLAACRFQIAGI